MNSTVAPQRITEPVFQQRSTDVRAARCSLREQIARLERASSRVVADGFPYIAAPAGTNVPGHCPLLLSFAELERLRDRLVWQVHELHHQAAERAEHVRRSRELLEHMQLEPGRYKFMRLPVANLGQGGCGAWEVRPRLGLIGMLAGWWHVKLSSGCPLPRGRAAARPDTIRPTGCHFSLEEKLVEQLASALQPAPRWRAPAHEKADRAAGSADAAQGWWRERDRGGVGGTRRPRAGAR